MRQPNNNPNSESLVDEPLSDDVIPDVGLDTPSLGNLNDCLRRLDKKMNSYVGDTALSLSRMILYLEPRLNFYYSQILRQYNLNNNLWFALLVIYSHDDNCTHPSDISNIMGLTKTSITRLSDELVARGLIIRSYDKRDRRKVVLKLTQKAFNFIDEIAPKIAQQRRELWDIFNEDELNTLSEYTYRIIRRLGQLNQDTPMDLN